MESNVDNEVDQDAEYASQDVGDSPPTPPLRLPITIITRNAPLLGLARALEVAGHEVRTFVTERKSLKRWQGILRVGYTPTHSSMLLPQGRIITDDWSVKLSDTDMVFLDLDARLAPNLYRFVASVPRGNEFSGFAIVEPRLLVGNLGPNESGAVTYIVTSSRSDAYISEGCYFAPMAEANGQLTAGPACKCHTTLPGLLARLTEPAPFSLPWYFHFVRVSAEAKIAHPLPSDAAATDYYWTDIRRSPEGALSVQCREGEPIGWAVGWGRTFSRARRDASLRAQALASLSEAGWRNDTGVVSDNVIARLDDRGGLL